MKHTQKWSNLVRVIASALVVATLLAACQCAPAGEAGTVEPATTLVVEAGATEDARVEVFYVSIFQGSELGSPEEQLIVQFEAEHPEIRVSRSGYRASPSAYMNWLRRFPSTAVMTVPADYTTVQAIEEGLFADLSDILIEANLDGAYPADFLDMAEHEGKQYFLPAFHSWFAVYYNRDVFDRYDLRPPGTWEEFLAVCATLSENGVAPIVYAGDNRGMTSVWFDYLDMRINGPEFHAALMDGQESYLDDRVRAVFDAWKLLVDRGYIVENAWGLQAEESLDMVIDGEAGMILTTGYQSRDELDFFRFPIIAPDVPVGEVAPTVGYVVLANSPDLAEATEFLGYLGSIETQTHLLQQFGAEAAFLPLHRGVDRAEFTLEMEQASSMVQNADHIRQPYFWHAEDSLTRLMPAVFRSILLGRDYEDDLAKLESARQQIFGDE